MLKKVRRYFYLIYIVSFIEMQLVLPAAEDTKGYCKQRPQMFTFSS